MLAGCLFRLRSVWKAGVGWGAGVAVPHPLSPVPSLSSPASSPRATTHPTRQVLGIPFEQVPGKLTKAPIP